MVKLELVDAELEGDKNNHNVQNEILIFCNKSPIYKCIK